MKKILLLFTLCFLTFSVLAINPHTDHISVSTDKSEIKWKGSKIHKSHEGVVSIDKGVLMINHGKLVGGQFSIDMTSIVCTDIESEKKNKYFVDHLKNDDFFDVENFPTAEIKIIKATPIKSDGGNYMILADLTIKGITHTISFETGFRMRGSTYFMAKAKIVIDRTKWDIKYGSGNFFKDLGDKAILDEIEFEVVLYSEKS